MGSTSDRYTANKPYDDRHDHECPLCSARHSHAVHQGPTDLKPLTSGAHGGNDAGGAEGSPCALRNVIQREVCRGSSVLHEVQEEDRHQRCQADHSRERPSSGAGYLSYLRDEGVQNRQGLKACNHDCRWLGVSPYHGHWLLSTFQHILTTFRHDA